MIFDFHAFVDELREKAEKKEIVEKYEQLYGPISGGIKEQQRYKEYVSQFETCTYNLPEELKQDFDRNLLLQLVCASFSSDYEMQKNAESGAYELFIAVKSNGQSVVKSVSELWSFQILRLYEIYIEEQMNMSTLVHQSEENNDKSTILQERTTKVQRRKLLLQKLASDQQATQARQEQDKKLEDLYGQL